MSDSTTFDLYAKNLSKIKRLTNEAQRHLHKTANGPSRSAARAAKLHLQDQTLLLVAHVFRRMQTNNRLLTVEAFDMDAIQEANLAALTALPRWDPIRGTLATWLVPHIKGALLDYANTHTNGGIGSKHNKLVQIAIDEVIALEEISEAQDTPGSETDLPITLEESLTYDGLVLPDAERETLLSQIRDHAILIQDGYLLESHYLKEIPVERLAKLSNTSTASLRRRLANALVALKQKVADRT